MSLPPLYPGAIASATILAGHGYLKGSLSTSGSIAAFIVGYGHLATPLKLFGVTMIGMYLIGSRATKVKIKRKAELEDGISVDKPSGNRNAIQVFSNSLPSLLAALLYRYKVSSQVNTLQPLTLQTPFRPLLFLALGSLSNVLADTLASELGILASSPPRFILSGREVPPGTNGGISLLGLGASVLGGGLVGLIAVLDILVEDQASKNNLGWILEIMAFGALAGLGGSVLDSLLGALFQRTLYSTEDKRILTDASDPAKRSQPGIKQIGPGIDLLSNSGVNFLCGVTIGAIGWWYGQL